MEPATQGQRREITRDLRPATSELPPGRGLPSPCRIVAAVALACAGLAFGGAAGASAATLTVDDGSDAATGTAADCTNLATGDCSLRDAVASANVFFSEDTIVFAPSLGGTVIELVGPQIDVLESTTVDASALPDGITITGDAGGRAGRIFDSSSQGEFEVVGLGLTGGTTTGRGGAIRGSVLTIVDSTISGSASGGTVSPGGAVSARFLTIRNSTISGNTGGHAVHVEDGRLDVTSSTIAGNQGGVLLISSDLPTKSFFRDTILADNGEDLRMGEGTNAEFRRSCCFRG